MFNEDVKNMFIETLSVDGTKKIYASIFSKSESYESQLDRDIFTFGLNECMELMVEFEPKSLGHISTLKSQLGKYSEWCISNNFSSKNYWTLVPEDENFAKFAFERYYVKDLDELQNIVETGLYSTYDKCAIYLMYMGVMGDKCSEISMLEDKDIDRVNGEINTSRRKYKDIIAPLWDIIILDDYIEEKKSRDLNSKYFIKPYKTKRLEGLPVGVQYFYRVFIKLRENYNKKNIELRKTLIPSSVWKSGMYSQLYNIEMSKGDLVRDDYISICGIYGYNVANINSLEKDYSLYKEVFWGE